MLRKTSLSKKIFYYYVLFDGKKVFMSYIYIYITGFKNHH